MAEEIFPPVSAFKAGLMCRCPRCGRGPLFAGLMKVVDRCRVCEMALKDHDSGDGPAVFVMFILGAVVVALALFVEITYEPPMWVHMALWVPFIFGGSALLLRPSKALLIAIQYKNKIHDYGESG